MRHLENRGFGILVDRNDAPGGLHANQMLDRTRNPDRKVQLRRYGLAGAADLIFARQPFRIDDRPRCADRAANRLGEIEDQIEILLLLQAAAAGNDDRGGTSDRPSLSALRLARRPSVAADRQVEPGSRTTCGAPATFDFVARKSAGRGRRQNTAVHPRRAVFMFIFALKI